ncbi:MAG: response regulator transcription factor [Saprospiraceae bacterium]
MKLAYYIFNFIPSIDMSNVTIMIVEDEALIAHDIARRVKKMGYDVAAIKHSSDDALAYLSIHTPDIILCDININGDKDGIDVADYVQNNKKIPLVFITALSDKGTLERAKKTLPYGYIIKPFDNHDLLTAIEMALYKHSTEMEKLALSLDKVNKMASESVSKREFEMLQDITEGLTNNQISEKRFIAVSTVKYHISRLLEKMGASNRADALHKIIDLLTH